MANARSEVLPFKRHWMNSKPLGDAQAKLGWLGTSSLRCRLQTFCQACAAVSASPTSIGASQLGKSQCGKARHTPIHPHPLAGISSCHRRGGCQTGTGLSRFQLAGFVDASQTAPAAALARSSWAPRGWSTLSRPPRAVRRSRHTSWFTRRSSSKRSTARLLTDGNNATYNSDFDLSATS